MTLKKRTISEEGHKYSVFWEIFLEFFSSQKIENNNAVREDKFFEIV